MFFEDEFKGLRVCHWQHSVSVILSMMRNGTENSRLRVQYSPIYLLREISLLCNTMSCHYEGNAFIFVIVSGCDWHWIHWICVIDLNFVLCRLGRRWDGFILRCELVIRVDERIQRDHCIELTYVDDVEQNILFSILVMRCYLYVTSWFRDKLCVQNFGMQKNVVQDTLSEALRSWRATRLV